MKKNFKLLIIVLLLAACAPKFSAGSQPVEIDIVADYPTVAASQPVELSIVADYPIVDSQYLMGKDVQVVAIISEEVVLEDLNSGEKFKLSIFSAPVYRGYEHNSNGLTQKAYEVLSLGYKGKVTMDKNIEWQVLIDSEKTFDKVFGSPQDLGFQEIWYGFVNDVNEYYSDTNTDPTDSAYYGLEFSENFTPSEACELASGFSNQVKIDAEYSFCQPSSSVWYQDVPGAILFAEFFGDDIDLSAVYPNPGDRPYVLSVGEVFEKYTFLGCFPVYGGTFEYGGQFYGDTNSLSNHNFVNPVGVVFASGDRVSGAIIPFMAEIVYDQFDSSKRMIFALPPECDFSK